MKSNNYKDYSKYQWIWRKNIILKKVINHFKLLPHKSVICKGPNFKIRIRPPYTSTIGRSIFLSGIWEKSMTSVVKEKVQKGWNVLDVGADVGYYSLLFATKCGAEGLVLHLNQIQNLGQYYNIILICLNYQIFHHMHLHYLIIVEKV